MEKNKLQIKQILKRKLRTFYVSIYIRVFYNLNSNATFKNLI